MALSGKRKVAMLLTTLDVHTAAELLNGQPAEVVRQIALELSEMDTAGKNDPQKAMEITKQFCESLQRTRAGEMNVQAFVNTLIKNSAGAEKKDHLKAQIKDAMRQRDPFVIISSAPPGRILTALEGESPQTIAIVLSALPYKLSTDILARLDEQTSTKTILKMSQSSDVAPRTVYRIGEMICRRLDEIARRQTGQTEEQPPNANLRKIAVMLNGLDKEKRDALMEEIQGSNDEIARTIKSLMVTWEDIPKIEGKSMQEALRKVDAKVLAISLYGADPAIAEKIRSNISERAAQMVDEETSLMSEPRKKDILQAREEVVKPLREANEADELAFIEES